MDGIDLAGSFKDNVLSKDLYPNDLAGFSQGFILWSFWFIMKPIDSMY